MRPEEAVALVGEIACRYPGWQARPETVKVWANEFMDLPLDVARKVVTQACRAHEGAFPPPLSALRKSVVNAIERDKARALPEPPLSKSEFRRGIAEVLAAIDGKKGPLAEDLGEGLRGTGRNA